MNRSTSTQPHLYAAITFHGYGHIAQTAAIIREMRKRFPQLKLTIQTSAPRPVLDRHIGGDFIHVNRPTDVGMVMQNALEVLVDKSAEAYRNFHTDWHEKIHREAEILAGYSPDVIFANVPYLTLAAASRARIPAIALCSLNWADIYGHYCREYKETEAIRQEILEAYNGCDLFLRPQPSMPMTDLSNTLSIDPIAKIGQDRRTEIKEILAEAVRRQASDVHINVGLHPIIP